MLLLAEPVGLWVVVNGKIALRVQLLQLGLSSFLFLLQFDSRVDEVERLLDLLGDGGRSGDVIARGPESVLVGSVGDGDESAVRSGVGVGAMLNQSLCVLLAHVLQKASLFSYDVVSGLIASFVASVSTLLLVEAYNGNGGGVTLIRIGIAPRPRRWLLVLLL